jgi:putative ABC transport system permease protein
MDIIAASLGRQYPNTNREVGVQIVPAKEQVTGTFSNVLLLVFAAVGCVLLIACVNVANLLLARATGRRQELAVRSALGASRPRLAGLLFLEGFPLSALGAVVGSVLAFWVLRALVPLIPADLPRAEDIRIDLGSLVFVVVVSVLTGLMVSVAPLVTASRVNLLASLQNSAPTVSSGRTARRLSHLLVVGQIAVAMVLLTGAALFVNSLARLSEPDPGFDPDNVLSFRVEWPSPKYDAYDAVQQFRNLQTRLQAIPGVRAASVGLQLPDRGSPLLDEALPLVEVEGRPLAVTGRKRTGLLRTQPGYFLTMGIPIVVGRDFRDSDRAQAPLVTVINESLARAYFPNENPVGKRLVLESWTFFGRRAHEIVGVVGDVKQRGLTTPPALLAYLPIAQFPSNGSDVVVKTTSDPRAYVDAVREAVRGLDPDQPIYDIQTVEQRLADTLARDRFSALLLGAFSILAVLLALGGLYGILSYSLAQRTSELALRIAMGAATRDIMMMMLSQGLIMAVAGVGLGWRGRWRWGASSRPCCSASLPPIR